MKGSVCTAALLAVAAFAIGASAFASDAKQVHATGCVQAGVEPGCLVVQDKTSGNLYDLVIKGARPLTGAAIEFTGVPFNGATTCMQGIPVEVSSWTHDASLKCSKGTQKSVQ